MNKEIYQLIDRLEQTVERYSLSELKPYIGFLIWLKLEEKVIEASKLKIMEPVEIKA